MIVGSIDMLEKGHVHYPEAVKKALDYLRTHDFTQMEDGKYAIDGEKSFALLQRYQTRPLSECRPETHRKFIDIQFIVEGEEYLGWCAFSPDLQVTEPYDEEKDVMFYDAMVPDSDILLAADGFAVLYPEDVHRPCGAVEGISKPVTKVVVKIDVNSL